MKPILTYLFIWALLSACVAQHPLGVAFQLFTDPVDLAAGHANLGAGLIFGIYDPYQIDYGFKVHAIRNMEAPDPSRQNWAIFSGLQIYPFGVHDRIFRDRSARSKRLRFHHQRAVSQRVRSFSTGCYGRGRFRPERLLKGLYLGAGYEFHKQTLAQEMGIPQEPLSVVMVRHGVHLELGYSLSVEFLWLTVGWRPFGVYSPTLVNSDRSQRLSPDDSAFSDPGYRARFHATLGITLFE